MVSAPAVVLPFLLFFLPESPRFSRSRSKVSLNFTILPSDGCWRRGESVRLGEIDLAKNTQQPKCYILLEISSNPVIQNLPTRNLSNYWHQFSFAGQSSLLELGETGGRLILKLIKHMKMESRGERGGCILETTDCLLWEEGRSDGYHALPNVRQPPIMHSISSR